jgi:hypothetical protein
MAGVRVMEGSASRWTHGCRGGAYRCEFIRGSHHLLESLLVRDGRLDPLRV